MKSVQSPSNKFSENSHPFNNVTQKVFYDSTKQMSPRGSNDTQEGFIINPYLAKTVAMKTNSQKSNGTNSLRGSNVSFGDSSSSNGAWCFDEVKDSTVPKFNNSNNRTQNDYAFSRKKEQCQTDRTFQNPKSEFHQNIGSPKAQSPQTYKSQFISNKGSNRIDYQASEYEIDSNCRYCSKLRDRLIENEIENRIRDRQLKNLQIAMKGSYKLIRLVYPALKENQISPEEMPQSFNQINDIIYSLRKEVEQLTKDNLVLKDNTVDRNQYAQIRTLRNKCQQLQESVVNYEQKLKKLHFLQKQNEKLIDKIDAIRQSSAKSDYGERNQHQRNCQRSRSPFDTNIMDLEYRGFDRDFQRRRENMRRQFLAGFDKFPQINKSKLLEELQPLEQENENLRHEIRNLNGKIRAYQRQREQIRERLSYKL